MDLIDPTGAWDGWRISGRYLIDPSGQKITPGRLRGLLWRDELELRRAGFASRKRAEAAKHSAQYGPRIKVVLIDLADYRLDGHAAS